MQRLIKRASVAIGIVVTVLVLVVAVLAGIGGMKVNRTIDVSIAAVAVPTDAASIERGKHFIEAVAMCQECHGDKFEGQVLGDDLLFGRLAPPNLTTGNGGIGGELEDIDYVRAIRHGIGRNGKALIMMPSKAYNSISDEDLGAMIAYLKSVPAVDEEVPDVRVRLLARVLTVFDEEALFEANRIDHTATRATPPAIGVTVEYGGYLAAICTLCHGKDLGGMDLRDGSGTKSPNLTSSGYLGRWSEEEFITTIRTGENPAGRKLNKENMPWNRFKLMTDDELKAVWLYLASVPPASSSEG